MPCVRRKNHYEKTESITFFYHYDIGGRTGYAFSSVSPFSFYSLYVSSMKQAAQTSSEQAVTQASNAISNYIGDMQEIMRLIERI